MRPLFSVTKPLLGKREELMKRSIRNNERSVESDKKNSSTKIDSIINLMTNTNQDKQDKISQNGNSMRNLLNAASHPGSRHNSTERIPSSMYGRTND